MPGPCDRGIVFGEAALVDSSCNARPEGTVLYTPGPYPPANDIYATQRFRQRGEHIVTQLREVLLPKMGNSPQPISSGYCDANESSTNLYTAITKSNQDGT